MREQESISHVSHSTQTITPHGGQDWRFLSNFVEDFSVTTNALGTPNSALKAVMNSLNLICHYPASDFEPAWTSLAKFLSYNSTNSNETVGDLHRVESIKKRLVLGNGASELIDLCTRFSPGNSWRPGPWKVQYKEYERSAINDNKKICCWNDKSADLLCIVNPCNPTGDFLPADDIIRYIETNCDDCTTVIIDESMLPWLGPSWRSESLVSKGSWVEKMVNERHVEIYLIHSWTKLWACPGLRLGSVLAPNAETANRIRQKQVPWSMNILALAFLEEVVQDDHYLQNTWSHTPIWRQHISDSIKKSHPEWKIYGASWLPFLWIETTSDEDAANYVRRCNSQGVPVRWGLYGYNMKSFFRIGVRRPKEANYLLEALNCHENNSS